ncbi:hypothetical protein ASD99_30450 [Mesorhizobium sp. Root695]|nr:hypothetical protein ASD99_30450 [Mesorhizobium sp. Root695]
MQRARWSLVSDALGDKWGDLMKMWILASACSAVLTLSADPARCWDYSVQQDAFDGVTCH